MPEMSHAPTLEELCEDARAYLHVGDLEAAVAVLLEGLRSDQPEEIRTGATKAVNNLCLTLWSAGDFGGGERAARAVLKEIMPSSDTPAESRFLDGYVAALAETGTTPLAPRRVARHRHLLRLFENVVNGPEGDIAECGCARGLSSFQLCAAFRTAHPQWQGETFHVFDSFQGLSAPGDEDAIDASGIQGHLAQNSSSGRFAVPREVVARNLHRLFPHVSLHEGWIPEVFAGQPDRRYRFVHVDVDLYQPTNDSLRYFFPKLSPGGIILTDDYNWPGAKKAFDEFSRQNALELHTTGADQAYFVKGSPQ